ncbi:MAG: amidohydrolase family protein, partial [Acidobacteria bacterium]|nr:amidohydrolase family protein [Acidobacteriota bacterium]
MTGWNSQGRRAGRWAAFAAALWLAAACGGGAQPGPVDLLVTGGRVIDPESGLDAVADVAVRDGVIVSVGDGQPEAREVLDATGLVVAPGFVDLHAHGQDPVSQRYQARDGVTTAMELEIGVYPVDTWHAQREGRALINYGATVSHQGARREAFGAVQTERNDEGTFTLGRGGAYLYEEATEEELRRVARLMQAGLDQGALGFGFGISYTPGASHEEIWRLFAAAAERGAPVFIHLRSAARSRA